MDLLRNSKIEYQLDTPLDALHAETLGWLKELGFWADELSFFYKLLHHHELSSAFSVMQVAEIDQELLKLNGEKLDRIRINMANHERMLASLFNPPSTADEQVYRDNHRRLYTDMFILNEGIRAFKQRIFSFF